MRRNTAPFPRRRLLILAATTAAGMAAEAIARASTPAPLPPARTTPDATPDGTPAPAPAQRRRTPTATPMKQPPGSIHGIVFETGRHYRNLHLSGNTFNGAPTGAAYTKAG